MRSLIRPFVNIFRTEAAKRIRRIMLVKSNGRLPRTVAAWRRLADKFGIKCGPIGICPPRYTARLEWDERLWDGWIISYNPLGTDGEVMRWICHEIAECVAIGDYPTIWDGLPQRAYYYSGGNDPEDARHLIAREVERLVFNGR